MRPRFCRHAAVAALAAAAIGATASMSRAATPGTVPVGAIRVVGTPMLYIQSPPGAYNSAWILLRTNLHLHVALQLVTAVGGRHGRSFGGAAPSTCIRSRISEATSLIEPGRRYRIRILARSSNHGTARKLIATYTLTARAFVSTRQHPAVPRCAAAQ